MILAQSAGNNVVGGLITLVIVGWIYAKMAASKAAKAQQAATAPTIECPTCHVVGDVEPVKTGDRVSSGLTGGLAFSRRARAQFHCTHCGFYW